MMHYSIYMTEEQRKAQAAIIACQTITTEELQKIVANNLTKLLK